MDKKKGLEYIPIEWKPTSSKKNEQLAFIIDTYSNQHGQFGKVEYTMQKKCCAYKWSYERIKVKFNKNYK